MAKTSLVIATELLKVVFSIGIVIFDSPEAKHNIYNSFSFRNSAAYAALPAILYAIQNLLTQYGYDKVDGTTFNILNQTKVSIESILVTFNYFMGLFRQCLLPYFCI